MKNGIVVVFPGIAYTCKEKLLVECTQKYLHLGYDIVNLEFSSIQYKEIDTLQEAIERTKPLVLEQVKGIDFEDYKDVIFISKSLGTACASWLETYLNIKPRQFYLTPLPETIENIKSTSNVMGMVIGTEDKYLDYKVMESFCVERKIPYLVIDHVGHSLKDKDDEARTEEVTRRIVRFLL